MQNPQVSPINKSEKTSQSRCISAAQCKQIGESSESSGSESACTFTSSIGPAATDERYLFIEILRLLMHNDHAV